MAQKTIVFDDFTGGEFGLIDAWNAPPNSWTGQNMLVYRTGELGVRPGLRHVGPASGLGNGTVRSFGNSPSTTQTFWVHKDSDAKFYVWIDGGAATATAAATAGTQTAPGDWFIESGQLYYTAPGLSNSYEVDIQGATPPVLTALTGSPSGRTITQYGDRTIIGDITGSLGNRLRFSDAADKNSWPAANFIDVGDGWPITAVNTQRQHLLVTKQEQHFVLTGVPGVNPILRSVNIGQAAWRPTALVLGDKDICYGWPINENYPYSFNGSTQIDYVHLADWMVYGGQTLVANEVGAALIVGKSKGVAFFQPTNNRGLMYLNGTWSRHVYGVTVSGLASTHWGSGHHGVYVCDGGSAGAPAKVYMQATEISSPGIEGVFFKPGDDSTTSLTGAVTFPEWYSPDGAEVYVRNVIVDFRTWATGSATTNHFDLTVNALRRYQAGHAAASTTVSFDEAAASSSVSGTLQRRTFGFGEQGRGNGFQLAFTNCRGMAIQRITVVLDSEPVRI